MTIRVLIADDSAFVREILRHHLAQLADFVVVGEASDGGKAQRMVEELRPDVVTMDALMPMVSGIDAIRSIMRDAPTPIVVVADPCNGVEQLAIEALAAGAVDVFPKPALGLDETAARQLADMLRAAAGVDVRQLPQARSRPSLVPRVRRALARATIVGIVASTGGPRALLAMLRVLPADYPVPIAVVQHTAPGFTDALASWLDGNIGPSVRVAAGGTTIEPGHVVIAPDSSHMRIDSSFCVSLSHELPRFGHRPSGDVLLEALASAFGATAAGIVCTGMGSDGAAGLCAVERAGGIVVIQDPMEATVGGMPTSARRATTAAADLSLEEIGQLLASRCGAST